MDEKTSCLSNRKVRKKNQISEYNAPSPDKYDEEDTRSINENLLTQWEYWGRKPKKP